MPLPKVNRLREVDIHAISIVTKGANQKRICLYKSEEEQDDDFTLIAPEAKIAKMADWSAFYVVVAEPGWLEKSGMYGDQEALDVWESEEEIRKAAHRFMKNGGLINKMHEDMEPYGELVESAVALDDIHLVGETIKKGSWYIAVEPTEEGKRAVEAGEFTGVSIQGTGVRLNKVEEFTKPGIANVTPEDLKRLGPLLRYYAAKPKPFTACYRDQIKHGLTSDHAKRRCAVLKQLMGLRKVQIEKGVDGLGDAPWSEEVAKSLDAVGEVLGVSEDESSIFGSMEADEKKGLLRKIGEGLGFTLPEELEPVSDSAAATLETETTEEITKMDQEISDRFEALEKKVEDGKEPVEALVKSVDTLLERIEKSEEEKQEPEAPKLEDIQKKLDEAIDTIAKVATDVEALGEGAQTETEPEKVSKNQSDPLSGLLD